MIHSCKWIPALCIPFLFLSSDAVRADIADSFFADLAKKRAQTPTVSCVIKGTKLDSMNCIGAGFLKADHTSECNTVLKIDFAKRWLVQRRKFEMFNSAGAQSGYGPWQDDAYYDGETAKHIEPIPGDWRARGLSEKNPDVRISKGGFVPFHWETLPMLLYSGYIVPTVFKDFDLRAFPPTVQQKDFAFLGYATVQGKRCARFKSPAGSTTYYVDAADLLMLRVEDHYQSGAILGRFDVSPSRSDGHWYPSKWTYNQFADGGLCFSGAAWAETIDYNTRLTIDEAKGVVPPDLIVWNAMDKKYEKSTPTGGMVPFIPDQPLKRESHWAVWIAGILVALILALTGFWVRRRRRVNGDRSSN